MTRAKLAICSAMKNENEYLLEWLCFHKVVGVEKFVIYNNEGTDESEATVNQFNRCYPESVEFIEWPGQPGQRKAFSDMVKNKKHVAEWVAFIDADEFLFAKEEDDLKIVLENYKEYSGVAAHWLNFGSSGHISKPEGLCIESFVKRARNDFINHEHVKSIVKIDETHDIITVHLFSTEKGIVNERSVLIPAETRGKIKPPVHDIIRINHYITKSEEQLQAKVSRGRPRSDSDPGKYRDIEHYRLLGRNAVADPVIQRFIPRVKEMMHKVMSS